MKQTSLALDTSFATTMAKAPTTIKAPERTFHKFGELPPELRIKIWQESMPEGRVVNVQPSESRQSSCPSSPSLESILFAPECKDEEAETWQSNTQIPSLLHVNAEARHEALKHYKLALGVGNAQPQIYIDFSKDTIFFGHAALKPSCHPLWAQTQDLGQVQRLAVVPDGAWRVLRWRHVNLSSLQSMIFVHGSEDLSLDRCPELVEDTPQEETEEIVERIDEAQLEIATESLLSPSTTRGSMKKRMQQAREELDTLMMVLPTQWAKEPTVCTASFRQRHFNDM